MNYEASVLAFRLKALVLRTEEIVMWVNIPKCLEVAPSMETGVPARIIIESPPTTPSTDPSPLTAPEPTANPQTPALIPVTPPGRPAPPQTSPSPLWTAPPPCTRRASPPSIVAPLRSPPTPATSPTRSLFPSRLPPFSGPSRWPHGSRTPKLALSAAPYIRSFSLIHNSSTSLSRVRK